MEWPEAAMFQATLVISDNTQQSISSISVDISYLSFLTLSGIGAQFMQNKSTSVTFTTCTNRISCYFVFFVYTRVCIVCNSTLLVQVESQLYHSNQVC